MNEKFDLNSVLIAFFVCIAVIGSCYFVSQCTVNTYSQYYTAQSQCVKDGGSFVPTDSSHTMCLNTK